MHSNFTINYIMNKEYLRNVYKYLQEQHAEYVTTTKKSSKSKIEDRVRLFSKGFDDDLYLELNEGCATGLFEPGFFESDLSKSLQKLNCLLKQDD